MEYFCYLEKYVPFILPYFNHVSRENVTCSKNYNCFPMFSVFLYCMFILIKSIYMVYMWISIVIFAI